MSHSHDGDGAIRPEVEEFLRSVQGLVARAKKNELTIEEASRVAECLGKIDSILQLEQTLQNLPSAPEEVNDRFKLDGTGRPSTEPS